MFGFPFSALSYGSVRLAYFFGQEDDLLTFDPATLLSMLITWLATGRPKYVSQDGSIAYISDVGADILKPLFVTGGAITAVSFFLSLFIERLLRHNGRSAHYWLPCIQ